MVHEVEWVSVEDQWGSILITEDRKGPEGLGGDSLEHNRDQKGTLCDLQYSTMSTYCIAGPEISV